MAGYNRDIVATRNLNKRNKARLRSTGDTELGFINGSLSHINRDEKRRLTAADAYDISLRERVEDEIAREGAGTINPFTGMPEYHNLTSMHTHIDSDGKPVVDPLSDEVVGYTIGNVVYDNEGNEKEGAALLHGDWATEEQGAAGVPFEDPPPPPPPPPPVFDYSYEGLKNVTGEQLTGFDPTLGAEDVKYFQDIFTDKPFGFLEEEQTLATKGLESAYGATMGALGSQQEALSIGTGRGITQAIQGAGQATRQSNMAFSGTITQGLEAQKKQLFQDYTAGTQDIKRQKGTALETLQLGKEGAGLDFRTGTYAEQQKQLDEYWGMIGMRQAAG